MSAEPQASLTKPLVIGHRGYRGKFPENTILAMREAVKAGAAVIETDIQLSKDEVVVMCHDVDTGRCFDKNYDVETTDYFGVMDQLKTKDRYQTQMPTLHQTAEMFFNDPEFKDIKLILDIKRSNRPHVIPYVLRILESVAPIEKWADRLIFGVWKPDVMAAIHKVIPQIDCCFIGWEQRTAKYFIDSWPTQVKAISVSYATLACCGGPELMNYARSRGIDIYSWTINDADAMKWAVASRLKGIITDFPCVLTEFLSSISDKDMLNEYFQSDPRNFYSYTYRAKMYAAWGVATGYLIFADNLPWLFRRY